MRSLEVIKGQTGHHQRSKQRFTGSAVTSTVLKTEENVRDKKHSELIGLTACFVKILIFWFLTPKISKIIFLTKIFDNSESFENFQKTGIYVIQLTVPNVHAKNQVSR